MVPKESWNETVKATYDSPQPSMGTIIENALNIIPVPDADYGGDVLTFIVDLKTSITNLSETVEPELPSIFDKEIEWLTLFFILNDSSYYEKYFESVQRKQGLSKPQGNEEIVRTAEW